MKKPNKLQTILSVFSCKTVRFILRKTGRGGTALPGIAALKICKNVLSVVTEGMTIVAVTGTNGKTTTCNMIEHALSEAGCDCIRDKSGANLLHGIASDLVSQASMTGRPRHTHAVLEVDEAALKQLVPLVKPKAIVVTNLFSDQVDRYGSVFNTLAEIRTGVERSPQSVLVLNAEDPLSSSLALNVPNKVIRYGMDKSVGEQGTVNLADAGTCPVCGGDYEYDYHVYAHLGGFVCPKCGYKRQEPDVAVTAIEKVSSKGSVVRMRIRKKEREVNIALPAVYNIYNAAACIAASAAAGIPVDTAVRSLATVHSAFGRLETFDLKGNTLQMILVKNPAGCNQAFAYLTGLSEDYTAVLCLNNRTGDGHDISWIKDANYELLCNDPHNKKIYVIGECRDELAKRLQSAGAKDDLIEIVEDYNVLVQKLLEEDRAIFALPNYTSMMELRSALNQVTGNQDFWK